MIPNYCIENELQKILYPLNFTLKLFGTPKYRIQNGRIIPIEKKIVTMWFLIVIIMSMYCTYHVVLAHKILRMINFLNLIYDIFICFGYTILFIVEFKSSQDNCYLIILLNKIHRRIKFSDETFSIVVWNWIFVSSTISFTLLLLLEFYVFTPVSTIIGIFCDCAYIMFDLNLVYAISILMLLNKYLDVWIKSVSILNEENNRLRCQNLFETFLDIMDAYKLYKKIFNTLVSFNCFIRANILFTG